MKIGFFGNTNNYPFMIAREIKKMGHEVIFIISDKKSNKLYRPEFKFFDITYPYPEWIVERILNKAVICNYIFPYLINDIIKILNNCDAVILNNFAHAIKPYLRKNIPSISLFSGSDLDILADYKNDDLFLKIIPFKIIRKFINRKFIDILREGIRQSFLVNYFPKGIVPYADNLLDEIKGTTDYFRSAFYTTYVDGINYVPPTKKDKVMIFNPTRFLWKEPLPNYYGSWENKRNDIMMYGLALFYKKTNQRLDIHFVEKGNDVEISKKLIESLGISDQVTWHKEMSQEAIFKFYEQSDINFEQLGNHWVGGAGLDAMLVGRPVIGNGRCDIIENLCGERFPICQAETPEEVCKWLELLVNNFSLREDIGKKSREFVIRNCSASKQAHFFIKAISEKLKLNVK